LLALGCWQPGGSSPEFSLALSGAITLSATGRVEHGIAGPSADPYYTITLGGRDAPAAVVFTRYTPASLVPGRYLVGEDQLGGDGFSALIIAGPPSHPAGVFEVQHGVLRLRDIAPDLAGEFELHATGFLREAPEQDGWEVTATGWFTTPSQPLEQ